MRFRIKTQNRSRFLFNIFIQLVIFALKTYCSTGIKFLDDESTDAREAKVLHYAYRYVSIYSNSWGPADTGTIMGTLTEIVQDSLSKGIHRVSDYLIIVYLTSFRSTTESDSETLLYIVTYCY